MAIATAEPSVVTSIAALREQRLDVQLRQLELHALLHRKLDLERLFECLLVEGQAFVQFDGLHYIAGERGIDVSLGTLRQHRQRFELLLGERLLGEVVVHRAHPFGAREEREVERLVESLVYPLQNALEHYSIVQQALTDGPTGLRNGKALEAELPREIRLARRMEHSLSVLLITVDYLESISEEHGTDVGEQAWASVADTLTLQLRQSDMVFRTESDEFCVLLSHTPLEGAMALAERLRQQIDRCVSHDNVQFVLTASAGVTELGSSDDKTTLLERAGDALRLARSAGRNQVRALMSDDPGGGDDGGSGPEGHIPEGPVAA